MKLRSVYLLLLSALFFASCDTEDDNLNDGNANVTILLADQPGMYESVWIDIESVSVQMEDSGWIDLPATAAGIYDLLELQNGIDTVLGTTQVPSGRLNQIRLILGTDNQVELIGGITEELIVPSGSTSGIKLNVHEELSSGVNYSFTLDFDASRSIVVQGNGQYRLKPVIRVFSNAESGAIDGYIDPAGTANYIWTVDAGGDTIGSIPEISGYFLLGGLDAGQYDVAVEAQIGFTDTTITGVNVQIGSITHLDTLAL